ncbi:hypothetical protein B0H13DRAFT_2000529, partial [Mycena leptocephala]
MQSPCRKCGASPTAAPAFSQTTMAHLELESADHLLSSNNPPAPSEIPTIHHIISAGRDQLHIAIERRIRELAETKDRVRKHTAIFSAIVCEIFRWTLPNARRVDQYTIKHAPWRLGHICQRWRAAALGYPPLWSSIMIYRCPGLRAQLQRSGNGDIVDFDSSESIGLILGHSVYWDTARFSCIPYSQAECSTACRDCALWNLPLPLLPGWPLGTYFHSPHVCARIQHNSLPTNSHLPWSQITRFRGFYSAQHDCLKILSTTPNLVECGMSVILSQESTDNPHIIALPALRRFYLNAPGNILKFVSAPALQELWISGGAVASLLHCIQRSSAQLVKLVIDECSTVESLIPVLKALPTLMTFIVNFLFDTLKITGGSSDICPNLSHIAVGDMPWRELDSMLELIESRWYCNADSRVLSFVRLFYVSYMGQDVIPRMDKMRDEGLDVGIDLGFRPLPQSYLR